MNISIAIPDSSLSDEITQKEKSSKISRIARACAIFQVDEIFIYHETLGEKSDAMLMSTILKYLETPQYFGKADIGQRITVQFKSKYPNFSVKEILKDTLKDYWGYKVKERGNLFSTLSTWDG